MKRLVAVLVVIVATLIPSAAAHAASTDVLNNWVSGPVSGTAPFEPGPGQPCIIIQRVLGTVDTGFAGGASLNIEFCPLISFPPVPPLVGPGTFAIETRFGTLQGFAECAISGDIFIECSLMVTSGTRGFKAVRGTLSLEANGTFDAISGTMVGSLTR